MLYVRWQGLIRRRYGGTFDDVWVGKELHDWLTVLLTTYRCEAGKQ